MSRRTATSPAPAPAPAPVSLSLGAPTPTACVAASWAAATARKWGLSATVCVALLGCGGQRLPDPKVTALAYASAVERGDADRVYSLLTLEGQRALGPEGTQRLVRESKAELGRAARSIQSSGARVEASAETRFSDGESATLVLEEGRFRVDATSLLPARPRTPTQALSGLRRALSRRSYPALLAVLSADSESALETDLGALVTGLEHPETLDIQVNGDVAEVQLPTGHLIKLKREAGVWRVLDFD